MHWLTSTMHRAVLTLLVGLMLSLGGGASALTFGKDGKQVASYEITNKETPPELLELIEPNNKLLKLSGGPHAWPPVYDYAWSRCSLVSHNLELLFDKCPLSEKDRGVVRAKRKQLLRNFQCGFEGLQRHISNATPGWAYPETSKSVC